MIAQQFEQIVRVPLEEASAAKRQAMVQKQRSTQFDQAPDLLLCSVVRDEHEAVIGHPELQNTRKRGCFLGISSNSS